MEIKIERKKVSEQVLEQLIKMIKEKTFPPNEPLPSEKQLSELFGVSRVPVREALSVLSASGVIESRQGGRSYVKEINLSNMFDPITFDVISYDQIFELLEMRIIIETDAAGLAAVRRTKDDLEKIKMALNQFYETVENEDIIGDQADVQFHQEIMKAAHNSFLIQVMENIDELYRKVIAYSLSKNVGWYEKRIQVYKEHERIYDAIKKKDAQAASEAMKRHLYNLREKLEELHQGKKTDEKT